MLKSKLDRAIKEFPDQIAQWVTFSGGFDSKVDESSWVMLGEKMSPQVLGETGTTPSPEFLMEKAARKIGNELSAKKRAGVIELPD